MPFTSSGKKGRPFKKLANAATPQSKVNESKFETGESNGILPLRICPGCRVPEPYQSPDWAQVRAQTGPRAEYLLLLLLLLLLSSKCVSFR